MTFLTLEAFLAQPDRDITLPFNHPGYGSQSWYNLEGKRHRDGDLPALISHDYGHIEEQWFLHGLRHRCNNPAVISTEGTQVWYHQGKQHRIGGPSAFYPSDGSETWCLHGKMHRLDGPAAIYPRLDLEDYYLHGKKYPYEDWLEARKPYLPYVPSRYDRHPLL